VRNKSAHARLVS
jgi:hypothetical protein